PLAAARLVEDSADVWFDLGSGGGSPAIPLKISRRMLKLTMVESKTRKAAFLREAVRTLELADAHVMNERIEQLPATEFGQAALVTVRAVRPDAKLLAACTSLLRTGGRLFLFGQPGGAPTFGTPLVPSGSAVL